jgi:hypothetical protein
MKGTVPALYLCVFVYVSAVLFDTSIVQAAPAPPTFVASQVVITNGKTNVRATPDGTLLGTQPQGSRGIIAAGPLTVPNNSVIWYQVTFSTAPSGWVGGDMLVAEAQASAPPTIVGTGDLLNLVLDEFGNLELGILGPNNAFQFSESLNQGLNWSAPITVPIMTAGLPNPTLQPVVVAERNGAIDVVFSCPDFVCPGHLGNPSVQLIRSTDHGNTWSNPTQISLPTRGSGAGAGSPVAVACGGGITVAWLDDGRGTNFTDLVGDVIVANVVGGIPGAPINLTNSAASDMHPLIVADAQSNVYVSWTTDNRLGGGPETDSVLFTALPNCGVPAKAAATKR